MSKVWIGLLLCIFVICVYVDKSNHSSSSSSGISGSVSTTAATKEKPAIKNASATGKTTRIASNLEVCVFLLVGVMMDAGARL